MASLLNALPLLAEQAPDAAQPQSPSILQFVPMIAILLVLAYFMLLRPERQKQQTHKNMLDRIKKNDRVVTIGGIKGVVNNVHREADEVTLTVDESTGTKIRLTLGSITKVEGDPSEEEKKK